MPYGIVTRSPNKRKIKINEENILRLITTSEEEDDEDEDFTISPQKEVQNVEEVELEEDISFDNEEETENESSDSDDEESSTQQKHSSQTDKSRRHRKSIACPTVKETISYISSKYPGLPTSTAEILQQANRQLLQSQVAVKHLKPLSLPICGICLNENAKRRKESYRTCKLCGLSVHKDCYNFQPNQQHVDPKIWFCDPCVHGFDVVCEFCPNKWGCMKETKCGRWCHLICARNILSDYIHETKQMSDKVSRSSVYLGNFNNKLYGSKECILCEDRLVARTGICIKCDAGFCKFTFHVTCAQKHGLLSYIGTADEINNNAESFFAYCPLHCDKEQIKNRQKKFILQQNSLEDKRRENLLSKDSHSKLLRFYDANKIERETFCPPTPSREQVPRLLSSDANFTRLLNNKAERMFGLSTQSPATMIPKPTEIRKRHYVVPSLTTDFASYYADRQLRLEEEENALSSAIIINQDLYKKQELMRDKYNEKRSKLVASKFEHSDLKASLESMKHAFLSLSQWTTSSDPSFKLGPKKRRIMPTSKLITPSKKMASMSKKQLESKLDEYIEIEKFTSPSSVSSLSDVIPDAESIIELKSCAICKSQQNQHLLVKCDVCLQWQHLACLDPPLTQMPKRTKFALWQCSECATSSGSSSSDCDFDTHGSFTGDDGRRLTRRSRRAPDKLVNTLMRNMEKSGERRNPALPCDGKRIRLSDTARKKTKMVLQGEVSPSKSPTLSLTPFQPMEVVSSTTSPLEIVKTNTNTSLFSSDKQNITLSTVVPRSFVELRTEKGHSAVTTPKNFTQGNPMKNIIILKKTINMSPRKPIRIQKPLQVSSPIAMTGSNRTSDIVEQLSERTQQIKTLAEKAVRSLFAGGDKPANKVTSICVVCEAEETSAKRAVLCDTCKKAYHWDCCDPPLKGNPKRSKYEFWQCSDCVPDTDDESEIAVNVEENVENQGSTLTPDGRRKISRLRKPPELFEPDYTVSGQQQIFKSLKRKSMRRHIDKPSTSKPLNDTSMLSEIINCALKTTVKSASNASASIIIKPSTIPFLSTLTGPTFKKLMEMKKISVIPPKNVISPPKVADTTTASVDASQSDQASTSSTTEIS